jgi:xylulose-5-phosphate/fructose-6-phosphate phosphoketolase
MSSVNGINIIIGGKNLEPKWLGAEEAKSNIEEGISIWKFASDENPDIVFASAGDYPTKEALAAVDLLKKELPSVKVRFVNVSSLSYTGFGTCGNVLPKTDFQKYFTADKPVIFNYHAYPQTIKQILFDYAENPKRFEIRGYIEEGSTTSPFDMQVRNKTDRYNLLKKAVEFLEVSGAITNEDKVRVETKCTEILEQHLDYIKANGVDMPEIENWKWGQ